MATNKSRTGEVRRRTQSYSPQNKRWTKRGPDGRFMDQEAKPNRPFKGVRKIGKHKRHKSHTRGR